MRRFEFGKHTVQLVPVADVHLLEPEPVRFRDGSEILRIARVGELVHHADEIRCVVDDVPGHCRPDEPGSAGHDDAIHENELLKSFDQSVFAMIYNIFPFMQDCKPEKVIYGLGVKLGEFETRAYFICTSVCRMGSS